eukprot:389723_1
MEKNEFAKLSRFLCVTVALFVGVYWIGSRLFKGEREYREVEIHDSSKSKTSKDGGSSLVYKSDTSFHRRLESEPGGVKNSDEKVEVTEGIEKEVVIAVNEQKKQNAHGLSANDHGSNHLEIGDLPNVLGAAGDYVRTNPIRRRLNFDNLDEEA